MTFKEKLAEHLLENRRNAAIPAVLLSILPYCNWLSIIVIALITLEKGAAEGFIIMLWASLPAVVHAFYGYSLQWLLINNVIGGSLLVWLLACLFRKTHNWQHIVQVCLLLGIGFVLGIHFYYPHLQAWWINQFQIFCQKLAAHFQLGNIYKLFLAQFPAEAAPFATGFKTAIVLMTDIAELLIARSWQLAYHAAREKTAIPRIREWQKIQLTQTVTLFALGILVASMLLSANNLYKDILPVALWPFVFAGISVIHYALITTKRPIRKIKFFYTSLIISALIFPYLWGLLIIASIADSFINFRKRLPTPAI